MSSPSDFSNANIDSVVEELLPDEAIKLIAGVGWWHTAAISRLGVPAIKVSDGPNGVRGGQFLNSTPAKAIPCATALGSTFDTELISKAGALLASEAKLRSVSVVLGPTVNIQRSPLGGRSFESFSEDPHLSGTIAAAYVNGLQSNGIGACIKHFVANDQEDDRQGVDTEVSPRALREIYLMPFMLAQLKAKPWAYMTAYNKVNGTHVSENKFLLQTVLRDEWKSDALTMSDWFGCYSISDSINAGLDLEMPGTKKFRSDYHVVWSIHSRKVTLETVKGRAKRVLELAQKCAKGAPEVLDGDGVERSDDSDKDTDFMRSLAAQTIVLLKNDGGVLPLDRSSLKKIAIIGGNAKANILSGGGSASLKPSFLVNPFEGITNALGKGVEVTYAEGAQTFLTLPGIEREVVTEDGRIGFDGAWYCHDENDQPLSKPHVTQRFDTSTLLIVDSTPDGLTTHWTLKLKGHFKPREEDTVYNFGTSVVGRSKLYIDGDLVVDTWKNQRLSKFFFGHGTEEVRGKHLLKKGVAHEFCVEFSNIRGEPCSPADVTALPIDQAGIQFGAAPDIDPDQEIEKAVRLAKEADVALVVVGLNSDWETEGYDRTTLKLPGRTDELVRQVAKANSKTVVITQAGSAIEMPWADEAASILHSWYLGNSTGEAIADVLFGKVNPCSKLSLTFPKRLEDTPSYGHFGSENGLVWYAEDLFVGYKHYVKTGIPTLFPFGHGLSYTTFEFSDLQVTAPSGPDMAFTATVEVKNTGTTTGSEIVQVYLTPSSSTRLTHPVRSLRGFTKVRDLKPGECAKAEVKMDKYALSYWCIVEKRWKIEKGTYTVLVGKDAENVLLQTELVVPNQMYWDGL
ncbi:hypothetical protein FRC14_006230 [Serendipita sp. 396]|nr:hypothetical protein FRC14_006230 [Serendipita sp. 396]KAG8789593.1 hypothetical protein FRC15_006325 [Serendipita sp. 397]KAG8804393.1 hypothetical protein FRC16_008915 [Serendipita sp. 398]KAG8878072.1 hypothetical protein FRC20_009357 [Serendipita sp. 405]